MDDEHTPGEAEQAPMASRTPAGGAQLAAIGAIVVLADWLVFELLLDEYFFYWGTLLLAAFMLIVVQGERSGTAAAWPLPADWLVLVLGVGAGIAGLIALLSDLRNGALDDAFDILGGLALYAGAFLMFWGARQQAPNGSGSAPA